MERFFRVEEKNLQRDCDRRERKRRQRRKQRQRHRCLHSSYFKMSHPKGMQNIPTGQNTGVIGNDNRQNSENKYLEKT